MEDLVTPLVMMSLLYDGRQMLQEKNHEFVLHRSKW